MGTDRDRRKPDDGLFACAASVGAGVDKAAGEGPRRQVQGEVWGCGGTGEG